MISEHVRLRAVRLLNEFRLLAEAPAGSIGRDVSKGKPGGKAPPQTSSLFEVWVAKFAECDTDAELELQLKLAETALYDFRHHREKGLRQYSQEEMTERILSFEGMDSREVAILCGPTMRESSVRTTRMKHGRNPENGQPDMRFLGNEDQEQKTMVRVMRADGLSIRSIAIRVGVSKSTVERWLNESKAA